jgi:NAD(P)-dependent dehydrogenase (short-subunit alcohol dehydrogenase family)
MSRPTCPQSLSAGTQETVGTPFCSMMLVAHNNHNRVKSRVVNVASWAALMSAPFIPFYNAPKFALIGLTESMFYDLRLLDIHAVPAILGVTKTPLLAKTTGEGTAILDVMPAADRARYRTLFDHYVTMSPGSEASPLLGAPWRDAPGDLRRAGVHRRDRACRHKSHRFFRGRRSGSHLLRRLPHGGYGPGGAPWRRRYVN